MKKTLILLGLAICLGLISCAPIYVYARPEDDQGYTPTRTRTETIYIPTYYRNPYWETWSWNRQGQRECSGSRRYHAERDNNGSSRDHTPLYKVDNSRHHHHHQ
jgi:hypothetical protein